MPSVKLQCIKYRVEKLECGKCQEFHTGNDTIEPNNMDNHRKRKTADSELDVASSPEDEEVISTNGATSEDEQTVNSKHTTNLNDKFSLKPKKASKKKRNKKNRQN